jgi:uncharacterized protein (UPF0210 family)
METSQIISEIKKLAKEENVSFLTACSAMQSAAAKMNDEKLIIKIAKIKMQSAEYKNLI